MKLKQIYGRIWGTKYIRSNIFNGREFIFKLIRNLITGICNAMNFVYIQIASLNKKSLKNLSTLLRDGMLRLPCMSNLFSGSIQLQIQLVQKCISKSHLESKGNQKIFVMLHLAIKLLKSSTFYLCIICTNVKSSLVTNEGNSVICIFTYDLTTPICSKIFNFINFVSGLDVDQFFGDPTILPCNYNKSPFVAKDHDHILTRNLRIIKK